MGRRTPRLPGCQGALQDSHEDPGIPPAFEPYGSAKAAQASPKLCHHAPPYPMGNIPTLSRLPRVSHARGMDVQGLAGMCCCGSALLMQRPGLQRWCGHVGPDAFLAPDSGGDLHRAAPEASGRRGLLHPSLGCELPTGTLMAFSEPRRLRPCLTAALASVDGLQWVSAKG